MTKSLSMLGVFTTNPASGCKYAKDEIVFIYYWESEFCKCFLSILNLFLSTQKPIACLLRCNCYAFAVQLHGSKGAKWCMLKDSIIVFGTKTTILRQNSSLLSSVRPIVFLQNENCEGPFLGRFLVKKLDIFSLHAMGEAYLFLR